MNLPFSLHQIKRFFVLLLLLTFWVGVKPVAAGSVLQVLSATPNWAGAEVDSQIEVIFNQSINLATFSVSIAGVPVDPAWVTPNSDATLLTIAPGTLLYGHTYPVMIAATVAALADGQVTLGSPYIFSFTVQLAPPPPLPSSFHGEINLFDAPPQLGDLVQVYIPETSTPLLTAAIVPNGTGMVYAVDVPGDINGTPLQEGGLEGDLLTFKIAGRTVATAAWHSGTSQHLALHPPQALPGGPYSGLAGSTINFSGSALDFDSDASVFLWDWNNDGLYDQTGQNSNHTWPNVGSYPVGLLVTDSQGGVGTASLTVTVNPIPASLQLGDLNPVYTGAPLVATVTTVPPGLQVAMTYNGSDLPPTNPGSYIVNAVITAPNYAGSGTGILTIGKAASSVQVNCPLAAQTYTAWPITPCSASYFGVGGLSGSLTPSYTNNLLAGMATVTAAYPGDDYHFNSSNSASFLIGRANLTITALDQTKLYGTTYLFLGTEFTASGLLKLDTVTHLTLLTDGAQPAASVGNYDIVASAATGAGLDNYIITYYPGKLVVSPAPATIVLGNLFQISDGSPKSVTADTSPPGLSLSLTYNGLATPPINPGSYTVVAAITDPDYTGAASATLVIKATSSLALVPGWNLVSFNVIPDDSSIATVLSDIAGHYNLVYTWDATGASSSSGNWMKYDPNGPAYQNSLHLLNEKMGFWIFMTTADTLDLIGNAPTTTSLPLLTSAADWNLVSYPSVLDRAMPAALLDHGVGANFSLVFTYHASDLSDPWKLFDPAATYSNDLLQLAPGSAYWIKVNSGWTWSVKFLAN